MKLQNEHYMGDTGSPTVANKPISFSEATKRISANIRKEQARDFHTIVDQYLSHMREQTDASQQWGSVTTPLSPLAESPTPSSLQLLSSGSQGSTSPIGAGGGPGRGGRKNYGQICLQAPRLIKRHQMPVSQGELSLSFALTKVFFSFFYHLIRA